MRAAAVLVRHSLGRLRTALLVMAAALALFQVLLAMAASELQRQGTFEQLAGLVPPFVRELFGTAVVSMMSFSGIMALGYYHVAIVAVLVGLVVAIATEPAAEVETGFADLVLAQPVSREAVIARSAALLVVCPAIVPYRSFPYLVLFILALLKSQSALKFLASNRACIVFA